MKPSLFYLLFSTGRVVAINRSLVQGNKAPLAGGEVSERGVLSNGERTLGTALSGSSLAGLLIAVTPEREQMDGRNSLAKGGSVPATLPSVH